MSYGEEYFWANGYTNYWNIAENLAAGKGMCLGSTCALRTPLYFYLLALAALGGKHYLLVVVPQSLLGAATCLAAFLIGRTLFTPRAGIIACGIAAIYPYYAMHDTAMQDTGMDAAFAAFAMYALIRAGRGQSRAAWLLAGLAWGLATLVRATNAAFVPLALAWVVFRPTQAPFRSRAWSAALAALGVALALGPWVARNALVVGAPILASDSGLNLIEGNNPFLFDVYPDQRADLITGKAVQAFSVGRTDELRSLRSDEVRLNQWYTARAWEYIRSHPRDTVVGWFRKVWAAFSWTLNPLREPYVEALYRLSYIPVSILGLWGMIKWRGLPETSLIALFFVSFAAVAAVYFAHTSHRVHLDLYWMIYCAASVDSLSPRGMRS